MTLICKEQAEMQRIWSVQPSARKSLQEKTANTEQDQSSASGSCSLLNLSLLTGSHGGFSPLSWHDPLKSHRWDPMGRSQLGSRCLSEAGVPRHLWATWPAGQGNSWLLPLSLSSGWRWSPGTGAWACPRPSLLLLTVPLMVIFENRNRGWKSFSVLLGKRRKASMAD